MSKMPDPIHAFSIFCIALAMGVSVWRENWGFALWHFAIVCFLIYLHCYKYSKTKLEK